MQKIVVFQQNGSGESKIAGINRFGQGKFELEIVNIDQVLPPLMDDTSDVLPQTLEADLVLDYLRHQDLSDDLSLLCSRLNIPVVASGKKITAGEAICPPICCTLARHDVLGDYSRFFGAPKIEVHLDGDTIREIEVFRGAPCGATWLAAAKCKDMPVERALHRFGLEIQFFCTANPAGWDPMYGKSPVHLAADVHSAALKACLKKKKVKA
ncbi:MAG: hypothetical protein HUN04_00010 [Desulfobacter sp.]|nr:MAG: hypothetical protein HUN04_00010 [Desulfobacter sp.]